MKNKCSGFTLIELLIVIAIVAILTLVGAANYQNTLIRSRDSRRKSDLQQVQRALELIYNDSGAYPLSSTTEGGLIKIGLQTFAWKTIQTAGAELKDTKGTVYMKELVGDPRENPNYCYKSDGKIYQIYAKIENIKDSAIGSYSCGGVSSYNYGVASTNSTP